MTKILELLHGKKALIVSVVSVVVAYLAKESIITGNLAVMIQSILVILGGGADLATKKYIGTFKK